MKYLVISILGVVQGVTEFLPISSDGHLAIVEAVWEAASGDKLEQAMGTSRLSVNIVLHVGTLAATFVVFWRRIWRLLGEDRRVIGLLITGTLPVVVVGLLLKKVGETWLTSPLLTGWMLPFSGLLLLWAQRQPVGESPYQKLTHRRALIIGLMQATAPLPGISRSGTTIAAGLGVGLKRDAAAVFSFLLALPAVGGACCLELLQLWRHNTEELAWPVLGVGVLVSFLAGLAALSWLLRWLQSGRLHYFGWWCIGLGLVVIAWQLYALTQGAAGA